MPPKGCFFIWDGDDCRIPGCAKWDMQGWGLTVGFIKTTGKGFMKHLFRAPPYPIPPVARPEHLSAQYYTVLFPVAGLACVSLQLGCLWKVSDIVGSVLPISVTTLLWLEGMSGTDHFYQHGYLLRTALNKICETYSVSMNTIFKNILKKRNLG